MEDLGQDLRYAFRTLARHKAYAVTAVLTLALGIGANTAIFSVISGVILRPLPFPRPDRLVRVYLTTAFSPEGTGVGGAELEAFQTQSTSFDGLATYEVSAHYLRLPSGFERVMSVGTERTFFSVLGAEPIVGRTFRPDDPVSVAVLGHAFWTERLGGDPAVVGQSIVLDDGPVTVIGVMPESFQFPYHAASLLQGVVPEGRSDLWILFGPPGQRSRGRPSVVGRLKAAASLRGAESELTVVLQRLPSTAPAINRPRGVRLAPLSDVVIGSSVRRPLFFLFGAVAIVLALASANVTNLSLVRMTLRRREIAVRAALGASSLRLVRQFLTESLLLSFAGGVLGLALAKWGTDRVMLVARAYVPRAPEVTFDWTVFLFSFATCALTGAAFGLAPALIARRTAPQSVLQASGGYSTMGIGPRRLRDTLVAVEVALAFVLAIGGVLLVRELVRLRSTDPGLTSRNVVTFHLGQRRTPGTNARQYYEIADRVAQLSGVRAAGFTQLLPLQNWGWTSNSTDFRIRGRAATSAAPFAIELRYVTPGYFDALGIPIRKGRVFTDRDTSDAPPVILINETLARRSFGDDDPVGRETTRGTIAGVVADVRSQSLDRTAVPELYYPIAQNWSQVSELGMTLVVGTRERPEGSIEAVRAIVRDVNPSQAIFNVRTMEQVVLDSLSGFTLYLWLIGAFAAVALLLALTGTYGVISYVTASRAREFAIRMALGAGTQRVRRLVLRQGARLTALGLAGGVFGALVASPLLSNLPMTVRPPDVTTLSAVAGFIGTVALVACLAPARRAARADPMPLLRDER